jgi:hypothetical protein
VKHFLKSLIYIVFLSYGCHAATLSELRTSIRRNVRDTSTSASFQRYSDADLTSLLNEAQREVTNAVWMLQTETSYVSVASTMFTNLPSDLLAIIKVGYLRTGATTRMDLPEKTLPGLTAMNPNWESQTGTPTNYYVRQRTDNTLKQIGLYPAPVAASTGTVYITYAVMPGDLSGASDVPFNGASWLVPYHKALSDYVSGRLKQIEGKNDEATGYFQLAGAEINRMRERLGELPNYTPGMVTGSVGTSGGTNR